MKSSFASLSFSLVSCLSSCLFRQGRGCSHSANGKFSVQMQEDGNVFLFVLPLFGHTASPAVLHQQQVSTPSLAWWPRVTPLLGSFVTKTWESFKERKNSPEKSFESQKNQLSSRIHLFFPSFTSHNPLLCLSLWTEHTLWLSPYTYIVIYLHSYLKYLFINVYIN